MVKGATKVLIIASEGALWYHKCMDIVAFDPSLVSTGVWIDRENRSTCIATDPKNDRILRLSQILKAAARVIQEIKPDIVAVESYAFGISNSRAITSQAEVGGIIRAVAKYHNAYVVEIAPAQWRSAVMGREMVRAKKTTLVNKAVYLGHVKSISGIRFATTDEADAWMIAHYVKGVISGTMPNTDGAQRLRRMLAMDCVA
jgi:Holliday junction resolvasome RuvABC endonuclease subunit